MRCKRLFAVLLAAVFLFGAVVPAIADDGRYRRFMEERQKDHPWQDEGAKGGGTSVKMPLGFVIGPFAFTFDIVIPFTKKPLQVSLMPAKNTETPKYVEERK
jgi:hypothetical protein